MKRLILYDLPCVLFQLYADELKLKIHEISLWQTDRVMVNCKYILPPSDNGAPVLLLTDNRGCDLPDIRHHVELVVFPSKRSFMEQGAVIDNLERTGSLLVKSSSFIETVLNAEAGFQYWSSAKILLKNEIQLSFRSTRPSRTKLFEIAERAQELCLNENYQWINSYFKANRSDTFIPLEINALVV